jgi:hypothetical protein
VGIGVVFVCVSIWIGRNRSGRRGSYYSGANIGFALQQLQAIARPSIEYQLEEQSRNDADDDDDGRPNDPGRYYRRLREKIDANKMSTSSPNHPPLKPLHPDSSLSQAKLAQLSRVATGVLEDSLRPGQANSLKVRPDGTVLEGNHRIKVLRDRGVDVDRLPREVVVRE